MDYKRNGLDFFRVLATIQVFLGHLITHYHLPDTLNIPVYFIRGVPILFALCGFLAAQSLERYNCKQFLIRRAVRILPGFWSSIVINTVFIFAFYAVTPTVIELILYFGTQFLGLNFYTGDWLRGYGVGTPNGVLWPIGVQIQFFVLAPVLHRLLGKAGEKKSLLLIAGLTMLSILLQRCSAILPDLVNKLLGVTVLPYLYFLLLGMAFYYFREKWIPMLQKLRWYILAAYVLWKTAEIWLAFPKVVDGVMYNTVTTILICLVVFSFAFTFHWRLRLDLTYGFYLYHMVFMNIAIHFGFDRLQWDFRSLGILVFITALPLLFAWLSHRFIEKPVSKLAG